MIRIISWVVSVPVTLVMLTAACGTAAPTRPEPAFGGFPAPVITSPVCGAVSAWPSAPVTLAWRAVDQEATYTIEIDCLNCGNHMDPWVSQSGTPWQVATGLRSPSYSIDVTSTVRREGGRAMRWRVWAVDRAGGQGAKTDWCVTMYSESGLPTPGARIP